MIAAGGNGKRDAHRRRRRRPGLAIVRPARRSDATADRRQRAAPLRLERVQLAPVPVRAARARRTALPRGAGHGLVAHSHSGHAARSAAARAREADRGARRSPRKTGYSAPHTVHCGPDGVYVNAFGARRRRRAGRHLRARPRHLRREGRLGARPRAAASRLRLLVAPGPRHDDLERVGHAEHGRRTA